MCDDNYPDFYQGSCRIQPISIGRLQPFLKDNDIALVMYYNPNIASCKDMRPKFETAAQIVDRPNVAFAAVNCGKDSDLCIKENTMYYLPRFKAYGYGRSVGELQYRSSLTAQDIATYVEELPVPRFTSTPNPQRRFY